MTDSEMIEDRRSSGFRNAQKAVEQLVSNGLLDKSDIKEQVQEIKKEVQNHQT